MGKRTGYRPGAFSWVDLATTDAAAAWSFYADLLGWEAEDIDVRDEPAYTVCRLDGDAVCGLFEMSEDVRAMGAQPTWRSYVTVADARATSARATELGGSVIDDPSPIPTGGRTGLVRDPQGAVIAVWEPLTRIGAERVNDVGCLCMNELATSDIHAARSFYERLFGWTTEAVDMGPDGPLAIANNGETLNASFFAVQADARSHWRPCFTVETTDEAVEHVRAMGGTVLVAPRDIGDGSIATVLDPQGAVFTLFAGEVDP